MVGRVLAAAILLLILAPVAAMQDSVKRSMEYVDSLDDDCVYDHGYRCVEVREDDFTGPDPGRAWVPGRYLAAWSMAYHDFQEIPEMTAAQKRLKHYKIAFAANERQIIVLFQGLLLPMLENGEVVGTMRATYGKSTKYWIDRETLRIDKRLFLR